MGLFRPESNWVTPTALPDLRGRAVVALDTETKDEGLSTARGPGWAYGAGFVCGVSWAAEGSSGYVPIRHPDTDCTLGGNVSEWLKDLVSSGTRLVFHNASYDIGWLLMGLGVLLPASADDTQAMAVMLDETRMGNRPYSLDSVAAWQGVSGKDEKLLEDAAFAYGTTSKGRLWRLPARYVGPYAEQDAVTTLGLLHQMEGQLKAQDVWDAYRLECDLVPMVVEMRRRGIRIDLDHAYETQRRFAQTRDDILSEIGRNLAIGRAVTMKDVGSPQFMNKIFAAEAPHIRIPRTGGTQRYPTGQPSFSGEWMEAHEHWLPKALARAERYNEAATKFMSFVLDFSHKGRLHAEIHQFKGDSGGTRSYRLSYSNPPLQQMPSPDGGKAGKRSEGHSGLIGKAIRECFLPEKGELWVANDYMSQEPRLTVHFAGLCKVRGGDDIVRAYNENPRLDYHQWVADLTGLPRPKAKIINLGLAYGQGEASLAEDLGISREEAKKVLEKYHAEMPYLRGLKEICQRRAGDRGYIRLIDGARMHYNNWESGWIDSDERFAAIKAGFAMGPCSLEEAQARQKIPGHPWAAKRLRRAKTNDALNNLVQGSAARQTKMAMLECWKNGYVPLLQMHDDLNFSGGDRKVAEETAEIMRTVLKLQVPVLVDSEMGGSWGTAKLEWDAAAQKYL